MIIPNLKIDHRLVLRIPRQILEDENIYEKQLTKDLNDFFETNNYGDYDEKLVPGYVAYEIDVGPDSSVAVFLCQQLWDFLVEYQPVQPHNVEDIDDAVTVSPSRSLTPADLVVGRSYTTHDLGLDEWWPDYEYIGVADDLYVFYWWDGHSEPSWFRCTQSDLATEIREQ